MSRMSKDLNPESDIEVSWLSRMCNKNSFQGRDMVQIKIIVPDLQGWSVHHCPNDVICC